MYEDQEIKLPDFIAERVLATASVLGFLKK